MQIQQFLCGSDNIGLLAESPEGVIAVDAPDGEAILAALGGRELKAALITHHHADHIEGLALLKRETGAEIIVPAAEAEQIEKAGGVKADRRVKDGEIFAAGGFRVIALATPGHTLGEISYYLPQNNAVFTGDTLFSLGCGRIFEGTALMMFASLQKLAALPPACQIYCGHEYSAANARFALSVDPQNQALQLRAAEIEALRAAGKFTLPAIIERERAANPFLRCDSPAIRQNLHCAANMSDAQVFAVLRQRKDNF